MTITTVLDCIETYMKQQGKSNFKNMNGVYLITAVLMNCDYEHYGPNEILQDALKSYNQIEKKFVESN